MCSGISTSKVTTLLKNASDMKVLQRKKLGSNVQAPKLQLETVIKSHHSLSRSPRCQLGCTKPRFHISGTEVKTNRAQLLL